MTKSLNVAISNGPFEPAPDDLSIKHWWTYNLEEQTKVLGEKSVPIALRPPQPSMNDPGI
jgi:hypothetical protein